MNKKYMWIGIIIVVAVLAIATYTFLIPSEMSKIMGEWQDSDGTYVYLKSDGTFITSDGENGTYILYDGKVAFSTTEDRFIYAFGQDTYSGQRYLFLWNTDTTLRVLTYINEAE